ncbi:hypothetical protein [Streptomyces profundus]|uniref:hypothetical protein n=1 Tax=Streptomyces profundus TaxID=2867410 RepID=UPI001D161629|nr:hypothetical protein [Streptomyces sp. MA3_2.13]UED83883.1 hypothetical protein K4G22_06370 [Streptomyces sp. MA3_2.13]
MGRVRTVAAGLLVALALTAPGPAGAAQAAPAEAVANNDPDFLQVYDGNLENLPISTENCPGDWHDLMYYMRLQDYRPDVLIAQQIGGQKQLTTLLTRMEEHFGERYEGVVAEANPAPGGGVCGSDKTYQSNVVIWRADRLELLLSQSPDNRWQAQYAPDPDAPATCVNNNQARTKGVKALLYDRVAERQVTAASFHWPTQGHGGTAACADSNARETHDELTEDGYGVADLYLVGGDTNRAASTTNGQDDWTSWYRSMNGDLGGAYGFRDVVYAECAGAPACLADQWTIITSGNERRIDFLFARKPGGALPVTSHAVVPTFDEGDAADLALTGTDNEHLDYSDHRAIGARVHY